MKILSGQYPNSDNVTNKLPKVTPFPSVTARDAAEDAAPLGKALCLLSYELD